MSSLYKQLNERKTKAECKIDDQSSDFLNTLENGCLIVFIITEIKYAKSPLWFIYEEKC